LHRRNARVRRTGPLAAGTERLQHSCDVESDNCFAAHPAISHGHVRQPRLAECGHEIHAGAFTQGLMLSASENAATRRPLDRVR